MRIEKFKSTYGNDFLLNDIMSENPNSKGSSTGHKNSYTELDWDISFKDAKIPDPSKINSNFIKDSDPVKASCKTGVGMGIEIEGWLFIPEEIQGNETYRRRTFQRTKIMSGGEFVSRTSYIPREYSFTCFFDVDDTEPYMYDNIFTAMQNKKCKVISPYISSSPFYAEVLIQKTNPVNNPNTIKVDVKLTEIPSSKLRITGDAVIEYPETTVSPYRIVEKETEDESNSGSSGNIDPHKFLNDDKTAEGNTSNFI